MIICFLSLPPPAVLRSVVAVGSGQALRATRQIVTGDAVLAHAPEDELAFMQGYGLARLPVMENRFVLLGPGEDPAGIKAAGTISEALRLIADKELRFLSRGDDSGTHQRERALWAEAGIDISTAEGSWYLEAGQGMGASINLAVQLNAYLLSDISTWLAFGNKADHQLLYNSEEAGLINRYSVITLNPAQCPTVNHDEARQFADWLTAEAGPETDWQLPAGRPADVHPLQPGRRANELLSLTALSLYPC